jgi:hypothetical protein
MRRAAPLLLAAFFAFRCNGTETDNPATPLRSFTASECDKSYDGPVGGPPAPDGGVAKTTAALLSVVDQDGLSCVYWERTEAGELRIALTNIMDGCGIEWKDARARVEGSEVFLDVVNPRCAVAGCGWCIYDFDFEVADVPEAADLRVHLSAVSDGGERCDEGEEGAEVDDEHFTVPAGEQSGSRCRFMPSYAYEPPEQCSLYMECPLTGECLCPEGTLCGPPREGAKSICLTECESASDCPVSGAFECVGGACLTLPGW